jgi:PAS domain S-box-containing protein
MPLKETQLAQVMDAMAEGLFVLDTDCKVVLWNRAMETLTGYAAEEVLGSDCSVLACDRSKSQGSECPLRRLSGDAIERRECTLQLRDRSRIPVLKHTALLKDAQGVVQGIVETVTDLRPLRQLEQQVTQATAQRLQQVGRLVGKSHRMQQVYENIGLAGQSEATVLVTGETGTGKELVAEAIHFGSTRKTGPLIKVNCSALSESLLESELFGHVQGAFTGAIRDKLGRFAAAHGGTIFLDEIGDISPLIQLKLLRVLQEREIEAVGSSKTRKVDVRVIAATHRDLREMVHAGQFREDLFYRLRVFAIEMPPLRERKDDIPLLVDAFRTRFNRETHKSIQGMSVEVAHCLMDYCWPGNVRELENTIEHAYVTCQEDTIGLFDLPVELRQSELRAAECARHHDRGTPASPTPSTHTPRVSKERLIQALNECAWNKAAAARQLGINRATVWRKMKQWGIQEKA